MGVTGDTLVSMPHLKRLAARGVRYVDAYANSPMVHPRQRLCLVLMSKNRLWIYFY
jgi:arylsulfatase A-like enzyme